MFSFRTSPGIQAGDILLLSLPLWCVCVCLFVCVTYKGEVWCILAQQSGEDSLSLDTLLVLEHIAVHEAIQHGGVGMNINVELQTHPLIEEKGEEGGWKITEGQRNRPKINRRLARKIGHFYDALSNSPHHRFSTGSKRGPFFALGKLCLREAFTQGMTTNPSDIAN